MSMLRGDVHGPKAQWSRLGIGLCQLGLRPLEPTLLRAWTILGRRGEVTWIGLTRPGLRGSTGLCISPRFAWETATRGVSRRPLWLKVRVSSPAPCRCSLSVVLGQRWKSVATFTQRARPTKGAGGDQGDEISVKVGTTNPLLQAFHPIPSVEIRTSVRVVDRS